MAKHRRGERRWAANQAAADDCLEPDHLERDEHGEVVLEERLAAAVTQESVLVVRPPEWPRQQRGLAAWRQ